MKDEQNGTKTIKLAIYFWTDMDKSKYPDLELPKKTCWDSGFVDLVSNNRHGIRSGIHKNFNKMDELPDAVMDVLKRGGIKVVSSKKSNDYKEALKKMKEAELIN